MDTTTLLIIIIVLLLLGGGWYGRGRWYWEQQSCHVTAGRRRIGPRFKSPRGLLLSASFATSWHGVHNQILDIGADF